VFGAAKQAQGTVTVMSVPDIDGVNVIELDGSTPPRTFVPEPAEQCLDDDEERLSPLAWRVQSADDGGFDEIVVRALSGKECLLHAEMMNERDIFVDVAGIAINAYVDKDGQARVVYIEDRREAECVTLWEVKR
jgi:hypothetical protein